VHGRAEPSGLASERAVDLRTLVGLDLAQLEKLGQHAQRGNGRPELVGNCGDEVGAKRAQALLGPQAREHHGSERQGQRKRESGGREQDDERAPGLGGDRVAARPVEPQAQAAGKSSITAPSGRFGPGTSSAFMSSARFGHPPRSARPSEPAYTTNPPYVPSGKDWSSPATGRHASGWSWSLRSQPRQRRRALAAPPGAPGPPWGRRRARGANVVDCWRRANRRPRSRDARPRARRCPTGAIALQPCGQPGRVDQGAARAIQSDAEPEIATTLAQRLLALRKEIPTSGRGQVDRLGPGDRSRELGALRRRSQSARSLCRFGRSQQSAVACHHHGFGKRGAGWDVEGRQAGWRRTRQSGERSIVAGLDFAGRGLQVEPHLASHGGFLVARCAHTEQGHGNDGSSAARPNRAQSRSLDGCRRSTSREIKRHHAGVVTALARGCRGRRGLAPAQCVTKYYVGG